MKSVNAILKPEYIPNKPLITEEDKVGEARPILMNLERLIDFANASFEGKRKRISFILNGEIKKYESPATKELLTQVLENIEEHIKQLKDYGFIGIEDLNQIYMNFQQKLASYKNGE